MTIAIVLHGGAWSIPDDLVEAHAAGCRRAVQRGYRELEQGGSALDAVVAAIRIMEDDPAFDAGKGSFLNADGDVELDASLMDGSDLSAGAVAGVKGIANPIDLARLVLQSPHVLIVGDGARRFALEHGMQPCAPEDLVIERERVRWRDICLAQEAAAQSAEPRDTVGAVALDASGNIVAGLSTGGAQNKVPGRVGDVAQIGCGFYADREVGGVACTGWGEGISRLVLAHTTMGYLIEGVQPQEAADRAMRLLSDRLSGTAGMIVMDRTGQVGMSFSTQRMARACIVEGMSEPFVAVDPELWNGPGAAR